MITYDPSLESPILIVVASLPKLMVLTEVSNKLKVGAFDVMFAPSTFKSPSKSTVVFLIVVTPDEAPKTILDAEPKTLATVTVELKRFKSLFVDVKSHHQHLNPHQYLHYF